MVEASIPFDPFNPGQVFACLGFVEAAEILLGGAHGRFDADYRFTLTANGDADPVDAVLSFLMDAEISSLGREGSDLTTEKWGVPTRFAAAGSPAHSAAPDSPATMPAVLQTPAGSIIMSHWAENSYGNRLSTKRDNVKFWAGSGGYPGAALLNDACQLIRSMPDDFRQDPFAFAAEQSSSFRFDWRRDYIPLDAGFSPNSHGHVVMMGYPVVEVLAAIGLIHARPHRLSKLPSLASAPTRPQSACRPAGD